MATWSSGFADANGIRLHYHRSGGSGPPLVLAHGVTDSGRCWTPIAEVLAAEYDVIMVDARGHGQSEAPAGGYDSATQAVDHAGLIAALGLRRPFILGHSMGAMTTLMLAGLYPDVPRAIVLEDPPGHWMPPTEVTPADAERMAGMIAWFRGVKQKPIEQLVAEQRAAAAWPEAELEPWAESKRQFSENVLSVFRPGASAGVDWAGALPHITCPALLLTADLDRGAALSPEATAALTAMAPHMQVTHIAGAGHNIRREQPERYLEAVRAFLAQVAAADSRR